MTKIKTLNRQSLQSMRVRIDEALKALSEETGIKIWAGNGSYEASGAQAHFKLHLEVDDDEVRQAKEKADFDLACYIFGLKPEHYRTEFQSGGKRFRLIGFEARRRKYPLRCESLDEDGKILLLQDRVVPVIIAAQAKSEAGGKWESDAA